MSGSANADSQPDSPVSDDWSTSCQVGAHTLDITFHSVGGDWTEDDMTVGFTWDKSVKSILQIKPGHFLRFKPNSDVHNLCDSVAGFQFPSGDFVLMILRDERPVEPHVAAILLNGETGKVMDMLPDLGELYHTAQVLKNGTGFKVKLTKSWSSNSKGESAIGAWKMVDENNGRIIQNWQSQKN